MLATDVLDQLRTMRTEYRELQKQADTHEEYWTYQPILEVIFLFSCWWSTYRDYLALGDMYLLDEMTQTNDMIAEFIGGCNATR